MPRRRPSYLDRRMRSGLGFSCKVVGGAKSISRDAKSFELRLKKNVKRAAVKAESGLKGELRSDTGHVLGKRTANTWRGAVYPKQGESLNSAASVWSKAPHIIDAFERGVTIKGVNRRFLAIPTENAPKRGPGGKKISPSNWPEGLYGKLRVVKTRNGHLVLIAENVRASYSRKTKELRGFRSASQTALRTGRGLASVVMFVLVPRARMRKSLNVKDIAYKWGGSFARLIDEGMKNDGRRDKA